MFAAARVFSLGIRGLIRWNLFFLETTLLKKKKLWFGIMNSPVTWALSSNWLVCQLKGDYLFIFKVRHLLQGSTCCSFRDGILHTLVVTSGYLSYCCLSIISNQSAHSPLTSDINKAFSSTQLPLTEYFLFFGPFSVNPRNGCVWKSQ